MPDGDVVLQGVPARYQEVLRRICDGQYSDEVIAHDALRPVLKDVKHYGDEPLRLLEQMQQVIAQLPAEPPLRHGTNWMQATRQLEQLAQRAVCGTDASNLALEAAKEQLAMLRRGETNSCSLQTLVVTYITRIYRTRFVGRIPREQATPEVDGALIHDRLAAIHPHLSRGVENLAEQVVRQGSTTSVRRPRRPRPTAPITLETDLAMVGR